MKCISRCSLLLVFQMRFVRLSVFSVGNFAGGIADEEGAQDDSTCRARHGAGCDPSGTAGLHEGQVSGHSGQTHPDPVPEDDEPARGPQLQ